MQGGKWPMEKYLDIAAALFALAAAVVLVFVCVGQAPSIGGLLGSSTR